MTFDCDENYFDIKAELRNFVKGIQISCSWKDWRNLGGDSRLREKGAWGIYGYLLQ